MGVSEKGRGSRAAATRKPMTRADPTPSQAPVIARAFERIAAIPGVERVRSLGMIGAADLRDASDGYLGGVGWKCG